VARHYGIPAASWLDFMHRVGGFRDEARTALLFDRRTHPNSAGHALAATLLQRLFVRTQQAVAVKTTQAVPLRSPLPPPRDSLSSLSDSSPLCVDLGDTTSPAYQVCVEEKKKKVPRKHRGRLAGTETSVFWPASIATLP
jgi:hypothetical protein